MRARNTAVFFIFPTLALILLLAAAFYFLVRKEASAMLSWCVPSFAEHLETLFPVQSIDTMKYSRDMARQMQGDLPAYQSVIDRQMRLIKSAGATHAAVSTPYDAEFLPVMKLWVSSAREHGLSVWFRGNFSGWEGWFDYERMTPEEHKNLLVSFIRGNPNLFANGDIFTPCPECENGGPGDPRQSGDAIGYRAFLIDEKRISEYEFKQLRKSVTLYTSMNGDIAKEVITRDTARILGGTILVDHYISAPKKFGSDIAAMREMLGAKVGLGEFGAPIPDLHGELSEVEQGMAVASLLHELFLQREEIPAVNYWTLQGGSTALLDNSSQGTPRRAYYTLRSYFRAPSLSGVVTDPLGEPISRARISLADTAYSTETECGAYRMFLPGEYRTIVIEKEGYKPASFTLPFDAGFSSSVRKDIILEPVDPTEWYKIRKWLKDHQFI